MSGELCLLSQSLFFPPEFAHSSRVLKNREQTTTVCCNDKTIRFLWHIPSISYAAFCELAFEMCYGFNFWDEHKHKWNRFESDRNHYYRNKTKFMKMNWLTKLQSNKICIFKRVSHITITNFTYKHQRYILPEEKKPFWR